MSNDLLAMLYKFFIIVISFVWLGRFIVGSDLIAKWFYLSNRTAEIMFEKYQVPAIFWPKIPWASISIWPKTGSNKSSFSKNISLCYIVTWGYLPILGPRIFCIRTFHCFIHWLVGSYLFYQHCSSVFIPGFMYVLIFWLLQDPFVLLATWSSSRYHAWFFIVLIRHFHNCLSF